MVFAVAGWGFEIWRQANAADDGGPPLGALCMAMPSIGLMIGAGAVWSRTRSRAIHYGVPKGVHRVLPIEEQPTDRNNS